MESTGAQKSTGAQDGVLKQRLARASFRFYENEIYLVQDFPLDKFPKTFAGWRSIAEARSESRPGKARRYAVKSLDTDLHRLGTQCHLSGECHSQVFPQIRRSKTHAQAVVQAKIMLWCSWIDIQRGKVSKTVAHSGMNVR